MKKQLVLVVLCLALLYGCTNKSAFKQEDLNGSLHHFISASNADPTSYVNDLRYTLEDFEQIARIAKKYGIVNPMIPTEGYATDYVIDVREEPDTLVIGYPHFSIRQSTKDIVLRNDEYVEKVISSSIGDLTWLMENNIPTKLYTQHNGVFITMSTAKPLDDIDTEFVKIMESFVPMYTE